MQANVKSILLNSLLWCLNLHFFGTWDLWHFEEVTNIHSNIHSTFLFLSGYSSQLQPLAFWPSYWWWCDLKKMKMDIDIYINIRNILWQPDQVRLCFPFKCVIIALVLLLYFKVPAASFFSSTQSYTEKKNNWKCGSTQAKHLAHDVVPVILLCEVIPHPRLSHYKAGEKRQVEYVHRYTHTQARSAENFFHTFH